MKRRERIKAEEQKLPKVNTLYETDYLLGVFDEARMGALRFCLEENGEYLSAERELSTPPFESLRTLEEASRQFEKEENLLNGKWLKLLLAPGSSLGGARPKATVKDVDGSLWIAKFPSKNDEYDMGAWEKTVLDLAKLCGHRPAGVMCEVMAPDGHMARRDYLRQFADEHNMKFISVTELIAYRLKSEKLVTREAETTLPTPYGEFTLYAFKNHINGSEHVALVKDDGSDKIPAVRVHSMCLTGDVFHSLKCDCNSQLHNALKYINDYGKGAVVYLTDHEGRGIGLCNKIKAYKLQEQGQDTIEANISLGFKSDLRDYGTGAQILVDLGYTSFNLITNNPKKIIGLEGYGLNINDIIKVPSEITPYNQRYINTKKEKMHHYL